MKAQAINVVVYNIAGVEHTMSTMKSPATSTLRDYVLADLIMKSEQRPVIHAQHEMGGVNHDRTFTAFASRSKLKNTTQH